MKYYSQIETRQDKWLIEEVFPGKTNGTFLDVGAGNGIDLSNSKALEELGWDGVCVECNPESYAEFVKNRPDTDLEKRALWRESGQVLEFTTSAIPYLSGITATIGKYMGRPVTGPQLPVRTVSMEDMFQHWDLPRQIDYMSLDTEGSEFIILQSMPEDIVFSVITVEHNYEEPKRTQIKQLLESRGYTLVKEVQFDDWYMHESMAIKEVPCNTK
jgi:FkbM family methyltransferase